MPRDKGPGHPKAMIMRPGTIKCQECNGHHRELKKDVRLRLPPSRLDKVNRIIDTGLPCPLAHRPSEVVQAISENIDIIDLLIDPKVLSSDPD